MPAYRWSERFPRRVSNPTPAPQPSPAGAIVLAAAGCIPYGLLILTLIYGPPGGDPSHYGGESRIAQAFAEVYALFFGAVLWIVIGILLLIAVRAGVPRWAGVAAGILFPISAVAALFAGMASFDLPGGWSILVPVLLPPLIAFWVIWLRTPSLRARVPTERASIAGLSAIAVACAATIPLNIFDELQMPARAAAYEKRNEAIAAEREASWAQHEREQREKFARLTPASPFADYLEYINTYSLPEAEHEKAIDGARQATARQQATVKLLQAEKPQLFVLRELWRLDITATPELCNALNGALIKEANAEGFDTNAGEYLEYQLPNMKFFAAAGCNLDPAIDAGAARIKKILVAMGNADGGRERWNGFIAAASALRQAH
jgi:hypothetical protein